mgnify:FL=1
MTPSHTFPRTFNISALTPPKGFMPIDDTPICLEIGAGKGKHALSFAKDNPSHTLYALERTTEKYTAFAKSLQSTSLANLHAIHADAIAWSVFALSPCQVEQCFILYPNPEPKNKNQRFVHMPFFEFLLSRLAPNGQIVIASNIADYITEAQQVLSEVWRLPHSTRQILPPSARTHFESKYLARGEVCQEIIISKPNGYLTRFDDVYPPQISICHD